jgi:hypothetical protein
MLGKPPASIGDLARRMTSRTTDLIAIGLIVVATLTLGRQVRDWWRTPPPTVEVTEQAVGPVPAWEDGRQPIALEFGDLPLAMTRQVVEGNQKKTIDALVQNCRQEVATARSPWREADEAERRLVEMTAGLTPVADESEVWQVFVVDERFPMVAGLRHFDGPNNEAARGLFRLVCWGLALPVGQDIWNVYVFKGAQSAGAAASGIPEISLPPGGHRNLAVRDEQGGRLVGFSGIASAEEWIKYYDRWFAEKDWSSGEDWRASSGTWSARFQKQTSDTATTVKIHFAQGARGELMGLIQVVVHVENETRDQ